ncbi:MAG TPA: ELWxxDGT repeat protein [Candidatus Limnocylindrales bacterium]|nr:ELWxxDGT repeat protein [Candidatus Limnocylindrales bacterium]
MFSSAMNRDGRRASRIAIAAALAAVVIGTGVLPVAAASAPYFVKNIKAGSESSVPFELTALGDIVIFTATGGATGRELWRSDGTAAGTVRVMDIKPGGKTSNPRGLTRVGDKVFFSANDGQHGQELWVTDGTTAGTHLVKDIQPGKGLSMWKGSTWEIAVDVDGIAFFTTVTAERLWRSDGTEAGTYPVPGSPDFVRDVIAFDGRAYFNAGDGKLWRSDGTALGTKKVKDNAGQNVNAPVEMLATDSLLFFQYKTSKLWRTDGTQAGTYKILDLGPGCTGYGCDLMYPGVAGDLFYFQPIGVPGIQVWRSDGTPGGTFSVAQTGAGGSNIFYPVGDDMYILIGDVWFSDGTVAGTEELELPAGMWVLYAFDIGGEAYFSAIVDPDPLPRLYSTDGTASGTIQVGPPSPGWVMDPTEAGGQVIFSGRDARGDELWAMNL